MPRHARDRASLTFSPPRMVKTSVERQLPAPFAPHAVSAVTVHVYAAAANGGEAATKASVAPGEGAQLSCREATVMCVADMVMLRGSRGG